MTLDWLGYRPYVPPHRGPVRDLPRAEAKASYVAWLAARPERRAQLGRLVAGDGIRLEASNAGVQQLNDWFRSSVEANPEDGSRLANRWYAVVNDIATFLGDVLLERFPNLSWRFFTSGKSDIAYQNHVIVGFSRVTTPKYYLDMDRLIATYAHRVIEGGRVDENYFVEVLRVASDRA